MDEALILGYLPELHLPKRLTLSVEFPDDHMSPRRTRVLYIDTETGVVVLTVDIPETLGARVRLPGSMHTVIDGTTWTLE